MRLNAEKRAIVYGTGMEDASFRFGEGTIGIRGFSTLVAFVKMLIMY